MPAFKVGVFAAVALVTVIAAAIGLGQAPQMPMADPGPIAAAPGPAVIRPLPGVNDALALVKADLLTLPAAARPFTRYLWVTDGDPESAQAESLNVNMVSVGTDIVRPDGIGASPPRPGGLLLLRLDLRRYAPRVADLRRWLRVWEEFQFDPRFSLFVTPDSLKLALAACPDGRWKGRHLKWEQYESPCEPYTGKDGRTYTSEWKWRKVWHDGTVVAADAKDIVLVRATGPHVDPGLFADVVELTGSQAPVVTHGYFTARSLSAIQDADPWKTIYGGLYYDLAGVPAKAKKGTDLDALLATLGIGDVNAGVDFKKVFDQLRSDRRIAVERSKVTSGPRRVDVLPTLAGDVEAAPGIVSVSHDMKKSNIDVLKHPLANLIDFAADAHEVIWVKPNRLHGYALYDGAGARQDEAPPDVAIDHTIPVPHHRRLQPGVSCISCHEADGSDGWIPLDNAVPRLLAGGLRIFGDTTDPKATVEDTNDRLARLYKGKPAQVLQRSRDDYAAAVLAATGPWKASRAAQVDVVKVAANKLVGIWRKYHYDLVTPRVALAELGLDVPEAVALPVLRRVLPPVPGSKVGGIIPEDFRLAALKGGEPLNRANWDLAYGYAAARAKTTIPALLKELKSAPKGNK